LFQGTGNVLQQSSSLFWDGTNNRLGLGTSSPNSALEVVEPNSGGFIAAARFLVPNNNVAGRVSQFYLGTAMSTLNSIAWSFHYQGNGSTANYQSFGFNGIATPALTMFGTLNVGINTTTDAGFRLDVNGTARVSGQLTTSLNQNASTRINISNTTSGTASNSELLLTTNSSASLAVGKANSSYTPYKTIAAGDGYIYNSITFGDLTLLNDFATGRIKFAAGGASTAQMTLFATGNFAINTTTDAGFRLDVNGTARVVNNFTVGNVIQNGGNANTFAAIINHMGAAQSVSGFNTTRINANNDLGVGFAGAPDASAVVEMRGTTRGFLPPRMTTTQKNAIASPATGLQVYDTTLNRPCFYDGTTWITL
jgi:hypothetical protein